MVSQIPSAVCLISFKVGAVAQKALTYISGISFGLTSFGTVQAPSADVCRQHTEVCFWPQALEQVWVIHVCFV